MNNKFLKTMLAAIAATIVMTLVMMMGAAMGMPKMEPPKMLAETMGTSAVLGWVMHFMMGIIFALMYTYIFSNLLSSIHAVWVRGAVFGIIAFVMAIIGMFVMMQVFPNMPLPEGSMVMIIMGALVGHIIFGIVTALIAEKRSATSSYQ